MRLIYIALLFAIAMLIGAGAASAQQFFPGECVTINTYLEVVQGPDPANPGQWLAQDMHGGRAGSINSWLPSKMHPTECPGPAPEQASCPASEPDSDGRSEAEVIVREAIRTAEEGAMLSSTVQFKSVRIGAPRDWTLHDQEDYRQGDFSQPIVAVEADYTTCSQDTDYMKVVERDRYFACFAVAATGEIECDVVSNARPDQIVQSVER